MKVLFDENLADDYVICWGVTVRLPKYALFGNTREERRRNWERKLLEILKDLPISFERASVRLASAWVRYYVFELKLDNRKFALNVLSPNSILSSFKDIDFPDIGIAKPLLISEDYMLQEWVEGIPLSEFRDGFIMKNDERVRDCIKLTANLLYRLSKQGYVYKPWEDYEAVLRGKEIVLLDPTRFSRENPENFFEFYYGAPFSSPDILKNDERNRILWRGISERDYFGTSREEYEDLFLQGIAMASDDFEEFLRVSCIDEERARMIWRKRY
ncbi:MAG: hypothetical protein QXF29_04480 [Archaeoglobaceae archaeon]